VVDGLSDEQTKIIEDLNKKYPQLLTPSVFGFSSPEELEAVKNITDPQVKKILSGIKNISNIDTAVYTPPASPAISPQTETPVGPVDTVADTTTAEETPPSGPRAPEGQPVGPVETGPIGPVKPEIKPDREYTPKMKEQIQEYLLSGDPIPPEIMETFPEATQKALKGLKLAETEVKSAEMLKESYNTLVKAAVQCELLLVTLLATGGAVGPEAGTSASTLNTFIAGLAHVAQNFGIPMTAQTIRESLGIPDLTGIGIDAGVEYLTSFEQPEEKKPTQA
jgi:hypothetical protein